MSTECDKQSNKKIPKENSYWELNRKPKLTPRGSHPNQLDKFLSLTKMKKKKVLNLHLYMINMW